MTRKLTSSSTTYKTTPTTTSSCTSQAPNANSQSSWTTTQNQRQCSIWRPQRTMSSTTSKPGKRTENRERSTTRYLITSSKRRRASLPYLKNNRTLLVLSWTRRNALRIRLFRSWNRKLSLPCPVLIPRWWTVLLRIWRVRGIIFIWTWIKLLNMLRKEILKWVKSMQMQNVKT